MGDCDGDASSGDQQRHQRRLRNLVVGEEREIAASIDAPGIIYHRPFLSLSFFFPPLLALKFLKKLVMKFDVQGDFTRHKSEAEYPMNPTLETPT